MGGIHVHSEWALSIFGSVGRRIETAQIERVGSLSYSTTQEEIELLTNLCSLLPFCPRRTSESAILLR